MKHIFILVIMLFLLPCLLSSQSFDYVTGYGFNTKPEVLAPLSGDRWLAVCTGNPTPGSTFQDTVVAVVFNASGEILFQKRLNLPVHEVHSALSAIGTPYGGFAISASGQSCDTGPYDFSIIVYDADGNLKWSKHSNYFPFILKISPEGDLVGINDEQYNIVTFNLENGAVKSNFGLYTSNTYVSINDFEYFQGGSSFFAIGSPDIQRWEKLDSSTYYLADSKNPAQSIYFNKIIRDSMPGGGRYAYDGWMNRLYTFDPSTMEYTFLKQYPYKFSDIVSTASNFVALAENDSSTFLVNIDFQGAIMDTIRTFPRLLKGVNLSYQNNTLAIEGINGSGPLQTNSWLPFNAHQLWLHTDHLNDEQAAIKANVALTEVAQNTYLTIDSAYSSWSEAFLYTIYGGQFRVEVRNLGETLLESVDVNIGFDWIDNYICFYRPVKKVHYSGLGLLPGESKWLDFGDVAANGQHHAPGDLCFWTSAPNNKPDAEPENDIFCKGFISTGTNEPMRTSFAVLPNPANESFRVTFQTTAKQGLWKMFDMTGKQVKTGTTESAASELNVNTTDLGAGLYALWINGVCLKVEVRR